MLFGFMHSGSSGGMKTESANRVPYGKFGSLSPGVDVSEIEFICWLGRDECFVKFNEIRRSMPS